MAMSCPVARFVGIIYLGELEVCCSTMCKVDARGASDCWLGSGMSKARSGCRNKQSLSY